MYPGEVAGGVLLDPIAEEEERMGIAARIPLQLGYPPDLVLRTFNRVGLVRVLNHGHRPRPAPNGLTADEQTVLSRLERLPALFAAFLAEQGFSVSLQEVRSAGSFGDRPLIVLRSEAPLARDQTPDGAETRLARLSSRLRQIEVKERDRDIQREAPDAAIEAVLGLVAELRGKP
jgi:hypothetical protein